MTDEVLVKVEGVSKKFCKDLKTSLWYGVKDLFTNVKSKKTKQRVLRPKEFWALQDISFELRRGECLGLIGHNGAGKSTLLKILNGLINPDAGRVTIKGRVGALIELGAGFNPILTGRENIYNNAAVLGFTKKEIDAKLQDIIDFAEIEEFIDMPVQNYSSGMKVRLGFAVAAQMEPDVLIIDEVLAVGDMSFAMKSFNAISSLLKSTAVIFVSHSMPFVSRISTKIIMLNKGMISVATEDVGYGIQNYFNQLDNVNFLSQKSEVLKLNDIKFCTEKSTVIDEIQFNKHFNIKVKIDSNKIFKRVKIVLLVYNMEQLNVALLESNEVEIRNSSNQEFNLQFDKCLLSISKYFVTVRFDSYEDNTIQVIANFVNVKNFVVVGKERLIFAPTYYKSIQ
jgi:lipopolysaccharide transport system ATP-binding protein